jgi:acetyl esterase
MMMKKVSLLPLVIILTSSLFNNFSNAQSTYGFEPATAAFIADLMAQPQPETPPTIDQIRAGYSANTIRTSVAPSERVLTEDLIVQGEVGLLEAKLYTPEAVADQVTGLLLYVHGGGFAAGDLDSHNGLASLIADTLGQRVLTVNYRRAPESKFPAGRNDVVATFRWLRGNADTLRVDPTRLAIGGESAGASHAITATLALRDAGDTLPKVLWVFVPATDAAGSGESHRVFATGAGRTADEFKFLWSLYTPEGLAPTDPGLSPLYADLSGLPQTFVYTAEFDPARSDGEDFAIQAGQAGVAMTLRREPGLVHQFPEITGISEASLAAVVRAVAELQLALGASVVSDAE